MNPKLIVIDGKTYKDVNEMPPDIRQKYEQAMRSLGDSNNNQIPDAFETMNIFGDKNQNGVPDVLENIAAGQAAVNSTKIVIDGKEFSGLEALPPEARCRCRHSSKPVSADRFNDFAGHLEWLDARACWSSLIHAMCSRRGWSLVFFPKVAFTSAR